MLAVAALTASACSSDDDDGAAPADPLAGGATTSPAPGGADTASDDTGTEVGGTGAGATDATPAAGSAADTAAGGAATGEPYVIGASLELTGALSELGEGFLKGAEAYIEGTNARGGVSGHPVELVALDHSNKPDQGVANVTRLINDDGAIGITGFVLSNACNAAERVASEAEVPMICSAAEPDMLNPVRPFMYGSKYPVAYQASAVVDFAESLAPADGAKVAIVNLAAASSSAYAERIATNAEEKGWEVAVHEEVPPDVTDMSTQAAKVASADPDVVFTGLQDAPFILFMRTLQSQGVDVPVINYEAGSSLNALEGAGSGNVYVARGFGYPASSEGPGVDQFIEDAEAAGVDPDGPYVINGYLAAMLLVGGLQGCGDECSAQTLQESLDQLEIDTGGLTAGPLGYTPEDHAPGDSINVYRWNPDSGEPELVAEALPGDSS